MTRWLSIAGIISAAAMLASCNDNAAMSLDQAKQITTELRGTGFTPPPRTIDDITAILDQEKPDPNKRAENKAAADAQPATDLSKAELAQFYYHRSLAAARLGRTWQRIVDLKEGVRFAREAATPVNRMLQELSLAEFAAGNIKTGMEIELQRVRKGDKSATFLDGYLFQIYSRQITGNLELGNLSEAKDWLQKIEDLYQQSLGWPRFFRSDFDTAIYAAYVNESQAEVAETEGHLHKAEVGYRTALSLIETVLVPNEKKLFLMDGVPVGNFSDWRDFERKDLAHVLAREGRLVEAEAMQRQVLLSQLSRTGKFASAVAGAVRDLGSILYEAGRYQEAEKLARAALDIYSGIGAYRFSPPVLWCQSLLARAQLSQRKWQEAFASYTFPADADVRNPDGKRLWRQYVSGGLGYAMALARNGRPTEALPIVKQVIEKDQVQLGPEQRDTAEAHGWLGIVYTKLGQFNDALAEFRSAVPTLLASSNDNETQPLARDTRLQLIAEGYMTALSEVRGGAAADEAFRLADVSRGQLVQRALADSSARAAASEPRLSDLARREQDAQEQLTALQQALVGALALPNDQRDDQAMTSLRSQIESLRAADAAIRQEIERRFPNYVKQINPPPTTIDRARAALHPGEALIATYVGEDRTFVWAVPKSGPVQFASVPLGHDAIKGMVKTLRRALDPNATVLEDIPPYDVKTAYDLYASLLKPVEAGWTGAKTLLVVAQGPLAQLPFEVLVTKPYQVPALKPGDALFSNYRDVPWLAKKVAIAWLPSVTALTSLRNVPPPPQNRLAFAGFGDPWFNQREEQQAEREETTQLASADAVVGRGLHLIRRSIPPNTLPASYVLSQLPRLPDTVTEVRSIGAALGADPQRDIFLGARASEHRVETMDLSNRRVILFATHGLTAGELNGLNEPALALTSPAISGDGGDGLLTLSEIMALRLNADWVVLSACNTAAGDGAGAEAVSGLGRGFFYAGARALLVTHWPVETTSAEMETVELFRRQAQDPKLSRAEALQQAKLAVIEAGYIDKATGRLAFSYAHPMFWAPYALVGDPGR